MLLLISIQQNKPNRVEIPEDSKDIQYHLDYARWVLGSGSNQLHQNYLDRYELNKNFYKNKQWILDEDTEAFFKDENNNDRNRLKVTRNYIQPMVEQYRGNAQRMTFDMKVTNISPLARSRRERALSRLIMYNYIARRVEGFGQFMEQNNFPTGGDVSEVEAKFNNLYSDQFVIAANRLLRYIKNVNDLDSYRGSLAFDMALAGIGIMKPYPYAGEWMFNRILPNEFGWDRSAKNQTLSDADYFFEFHDAAVTTLLERYQSISYEDRKQLEKFASNIVGINPTTNESFDVVGRVPIYTAVWRDLTVDIFGYVTDQYGQRILGRINYIAPDSTEPEYTEKNLVPYKDLTEYQKRVVRGNQIASLYVDLWRYCDFVPAEILSAGANRVKDIALEHGIMPYQEVDLYHPTNMTPPYKVGTWSYFDGETISPVDVVINPQRMINRFLSVMENQINNSGGAGVIFDKDLIGVTPEDEIKGSIMKGEAIGVHAKGRGVQNIVGRYDSTPKESVVAFATLIENFKQGIEQVTGINEGVKGDTGNPDQLVGVMQLMIQRGSIIQEPFYQAISDIYKGCYQSAISSGKRYYIDNDVELVDAVGEESAQVLKLSKDMRNESLKVSLVRSMDAMNERMTVDSTLMAWLQYGLMDQETVGYLYGKASMEEAVNALKDFQKRLANQKRMASVAANNAAAQRNQAAEVAGEVIYNESIADKTRENLNKEKDRVVKLAGKGPKK